MENSLGHSKPNVDPFPPRPAPPAGKHCPKCGEPMVLHKDGHSDRLQPRCRPCTATAQRRCQQRKSLRRLKRISREAQKSSLSAEELRDHLKVIVRLSGGWSGLRDALPAVERAKLAVQLAKVSNREAERAEAARRREALSAAVLDSPAMQADLGNMSQEWVAKHPVRAMRVVLCDNAHLAARMLLETERGRAALRRALERDPQALEEG